MAFCGATFSIEVKEEETVIDHSLKNVYAFSTRKKQMIAPTKEGLLTVDKDNIYVDRRTKIVYRDVKFNLLSYRSLYQMTAKLPGARTGVGSCVGISYNGPKILTCAHNLASVSTRNKRVVSHKEPYVYGARQGEASWACLYKLDDKKIRVHPKYDGQPDTGFDIGVCPRSKSLSSRGDKSIYPKWKKDNVNWGSAHPEAIKKGMTIELAGYPGEKAGYPYTHSGVIKDVVKTTLGGYLLYYNADATPGNSGSGIMITDERYVKRYGKKKIIIGVHTGHDDVDGLNFGTLITPSLKKWILSQGKEDN